MPVSLASTLKQQWDQLGTIVTAEMSSGGRLTPLSYMTKSFHLWRQTSSGKLRSPAIGIQAKKATPVHKTEQMPHGPPANKILVLSTFQMVLAVQSTLETANVNIEASAPPSLEDANIVMQPLLDDGAGNGIFPVLFDPKNYTLNGNAFYTEITDIEYEWEIKPAAGDNAQIWLYGMVTYQAQQLVFRL